MTSRATSSFILYTLTSLALIHPLSQHVHPFKALLQSCFSWLVALTGFLCMASLALLSSLHPGESDLSSPGRPFTAFSHQTCGANQRLVAPLLDTCCVSQKIIFLLPPYRGISTLQKGSADVSSSFFQVFFKNLPLNFKLETEHIVIPLKVPPAAAGVTLQWV